MWVTNRRDCACLGATTRSLRLTSITRYYGKNVVLYRHVVYTTYHSPQERCRFKIPSTVSDESMLGPHNSKVRKLLSQIIMSYVVCKTASLQTQLWRFAMFSSRMFQ